MGVEGHAGLFSTADDLSVLFTMLLNGGSYGGVQYIQPETVELFTKNRAVFPPRIRLGQTRDRSVQKQSGRQYASAATYGHQGFTGICVWADPVNDVLFVFLSNRVQPSADPNMLSREDIRNRMMDVV